MRIRQLLFLGVAVSALMGCAAGKMLMAGYTPPQTIADLLNEQYAMAGELPPELAPNGRENNPIGIENYADDTLGNTNEALDVSTGNADIYGMSAYRQIESFRPRFTYKTLDDYAGQLAMSLMQNRIALGKHTKVGISSFVKLDYSLQNTTVLGNQLAEHLISNMQQLGLPVVDHKIMPALTVTERGDIAFSRDVMQLSEKNIMNHVLSGTLIQKSNGVFVNARIISLETHQVVSSATILIPDFLSEQINAGFAYR
uniref:FlgO family outer membrane protein n=1 Tax=Ningiella ruwaisensis TaxID=2364274 RepID=UPI00109FA9F4|nr:FlgO family outer membrane protein [Ningiella ruwaisensis]